MRPDELQGTGVAVDVHQGALLSIGCNTYDFISQLTSAESDAQGLFSSLTSGPSSLIAASDAEVLLSPTRAEIDAQLRKFLLSQKGVETFTLFFAGHGVVADGSLYLCTRDTDPKAISVSGLNISHVLRFIAELRPRHGYVIIDACFSGAVALDFGTILRSDIQERLPAFGLSVLASSHPRKTALETTEGGLLTVELLRALRGDTTVNETSRTLGLGEIVRKLDLISALARQAPNFWDLNLNGPDVFCRNPRYVASSPTEEAFGFVTHRRHHANLSEALLRSLWRQYLDLPNIVLPDLFPLFQQVVQELSSNPDSIWPTCLAIADSFSAKLSNHPDTFASIEARSQMLRALLASGNAPDNDRAMTALLSLIYREASAALAALVSRLAVDKNALVEGGLGDLYVLPIRISRILGWIGVLMRIAHIREHNVLTLVELRALTRLLLAHYGNSIVAVGEDQASGFLVFLSQAWNHNWVSEGEEVVGRLYNDFNENYARVLINDPAPAHIIDYLLAKDDRPLTLEAPYLQAPSELLSVILVCAALFGLDEAIDDTLIEIDHSPFSFYVPASYADFWQDNMEDGLSFVFQLGHGLKLGNGVWSLMDMRRTWNGDIRPVVEEAMSLSSDAEIQAAIILSLVIPDRLAWNAIPCCPTSQHARLSGS